VLFDYNDVWDLRFSWQWRCCLWSSLLWCCVTSIFRVDEDGGNTFLWNTGKHLQDDMGSQTREHDWDVKILPVWRWRYKSFQHVFFTCAVAGVKHRHMKKKNMSVFMYEQLQLSLMLFALFCVPAMSVSLN
jgi:hypothetical protein